MPARQLDAVARHLRQLAGGVATRDTTDAELLGRYVSVHDESAFAALVERHGGLVWSVCRRLLSRPEDVEDAFQATFLVLVRKAASIRKRGAVASWLYGVAYRTSMRAKDTSARRREQPLPEAVRELEQPVSAAALREVQALLDQEVERLPEKYRAPFVLCCLEGKSKPEAARELGWKEGTVSGRLARARKLLQQRLARRGVARSAALCALAVGHGAGAAAVPVGLAVATLRVAAGGQAAEAVSARAVGLANAARVGMAMSKVKGGAMLMLALGILTGAVVARHAQVPEPPPPGGPKPTAKGAVQSPPAHWVRARTDRFGDPLPDGALARLGTVRWRLGAYLADAMAVSRGSKSLITANPQEGITIIDMVTGGTISHVPVDPGPHKHWLGPMGTVALSGDARLAAFGGRDGTLCLLELPGGKARREWHGHSARVGEAALSFHGEVLATRSDDGTLRLWETASGKELLRLAVNAQVRDQYRPAELALSPDGKEFAWIGDDKERVVQVCSTATGRVLHRLRGHAGFRRRVLFSPDGRKLVTTSDRGPGQVWEAKSGRLLLSLHLKPGLGPAPVAFAPDGKTLVITVEQDAMRLVDVATGQDLWRVPRLYSSTKLDTFAFTPDGKTLVVTAGAFDHAIYRYDTATGKRLPSPAAPDTCPEAIAFAPGNRGLYSFGEDYIPWHWDGVTGRELGGVRTGPANGLFSPDGRLLVASEEGAIHLYDTATGKDRRQLTVRSTRYAQLMAFSPEGRRLAAAVSGAKGALVHVWETDGWKELEPISTGLAEPLIQMMLFPDGKDLLGHTSSGIAQDRQRLFCWDVTTGRQRRAANLPSHFGSVLLSPDGKTLAVPCGWKRIDFWELATGETRFELPPVRIWPCTMRFSPDGALFLIGDEDGGVRIHDAVSGRLLRHVRGHRGQVLAFAFSANGRRLATASRDTTALVWDLAGLLPRDPGTARLAPAELTKLWDDLGRDAAKASRAAAALRDASGQVLPFMQMRVHPAPAIEAPAAAGPIRDLDDRRFIVRQKAAGELARLGSAAEPALRRALRGKASPEVCRQVEQLLVRLEPMHSPQVLRALRAVELLEHIGTPAARELLEKLAAGLPDARLTQEAKASLGRLSRRATAP
jgi:RNA polymerase sigma factor (sigma-70 family)